MEHELLFRKWLDNDLNEKELEDFKNLEAYQDVIQLSDRLKKFKPKTPNYDNMLAQITATSKRRVYTINQHILKYAAIFVIGFGLFYLGINYINNKSALHQTHYAQTEALKLPDNSLVSMNAETTLSYDKNNWLNHKVVELDGEAFFKVSKGQKFDVKTKQGIVSVLGTEFNVNSRTDFFEVICYEGKVSVLVNGTSHILKPHDKISMIKGVLKEEIIKETTPNWENKYSEFSSTPLIYVLDEIKRQYNVTFEYEDIDTTTLFSGRIIHSNINVALESITIPLKLDYTIKNNSVILAPNKAK